MTDPTSSTPLGAKPTRAEVVRQVLGLVESFVTSRPYQPPEAQPGLQVQMLNQVWAAIERGRDRDSEAAVLVRVAPELLEKIATDDCEPVVIVGIDRQDDGTYDMVLRSAVKPTDAMANCAWWITAALTRITDPPAARKDLAMALDCLPPEVRDA